MALRGRQVLGAAASGAGWAGLLVATATSDWVRSCDYTLATCLRIDELRSQGLWVECIVSPAQSHCGARDQILELPAYVQTSRALMVVSCLLGLPALLLVLASMPCVRLHSPTPPSSSSSVKRCRARVGGVLFLAMAVLGGVSTAWFPVGAHQDQGLQSFGFSLYAGWIGSALCLLGGLTVLLCHAPPPPGGHGSFYYSRRGDQEGLGGLKPLEPPPASHARTARV